MAHLFGGTHEQSYIAHVMAFAACLNSFRNESHCSSVTEQRTNLLEISLNRAIDRNEFIRNERSNEYGMSLESNRSDRSVMDSMMIDLLVISIVILYAFQSLNFTGQSIA